MTVDRRWLLATVVATILVSIPGPDGVASTLPPPSTSSPDGSVSTATTSPRAIFRARRTNHPHDRAAVELLARLAHERQLGFEVVDEASGLVSRHGRWDRADALGGDISGRPGRLPADLVVEVEEIAAVSSRAVYDVVLSECRIELTATVRTARDGVVASRSTSSAVAVEDSEAAALEAARRAAIAEIGDPLLDEMRKTLADLESGRLDVVVECVEGDLKSFLDTVPGADSRLRLAEDGIDGVDVVKVSMSDWRSMSDRGLVILDMRPGWVLVSTDASDSAFRGPGWRFLSVLVGAVLSMAVLAAVGRGLAARFRASQ